MKSAAPYERSDMRAQYPDTRIVIQFVMAGLVSVIHVFLAATSQRRECPGLEREHAFRAFARE